MGGVVGGVVPGSVSSAPQAAPKGPKNSEALTSSPAVVSAAGEVNPLLLMIVYALSVSVALISVTILSVKVITTNIQDKIIYYTKYLPKISAIILVIMAITFVLGLV